MPVTASDLSANGVNPRVAEHLATQINSLDPTVQQRFAKTVIDFYQTYGGQGYDLDINQGARTTAQQRAIQATGVKAAAPNNSWHTVGGAADFTVWKNGMPDRGTTSGNPYRTLLAPIAKANGLANPISGDVGHFQPTEVPKARSGLALAEFLPPTTAVASLTPPAIQASFQRRPQDAIAANFSGMAPRALPAVLSYAEQDALPVPPRSILDPVPAPNLRPAIPAAPQGLASAEALVMAALVGNASEVKTAGNALLGTVMFGGDAAKQAVTQYFERVGTESPYAHIIAGRLEAEPQLAAALPKAFGFDRAIIGALTSLPPPTTRYSEPTHEHIAEPSSLSPAAPPKTTVAMPTMPLPHPGQSVNAAPIVTRTSAPAISLPHPISKPAQTAALPSAKIASAAPFVPAPPVKQPANVSRPYFDDQFKGINPDPVPRAPAMPLLHPGQSLGMTPVAKTIPTVPKPVSIPTPTQAPVSSVSYRQPPAVRPVQPIMQPNMASRPSAPATLGGPGNSIFGGVLNAISLPSNSAIPAPAQQVMGQTYGSGASSFTPTSYSPANFTPSAGGSKYNISIGTNAQGQSVGTFQNSQGKTITYLR